MHTFKFPDHTCLKMTIKADIGKQYIATYTNKIISKDLAHVSIEYGNKKWETTRETCCVNPLEMLVSEQCRTT